MWLLLFIAVAVYAYYVSNRVSNLESVSNRAAFISQCIKYKNRIGNLPPDMEHVYKLAAIHHIDLSRDSIIVHEIFRDDSQPVDFSYVSLWIQKGGNNVS